MIRPWIEITLATLLVFVSFKQYGISRDQTDIIANQLSATQKQLRAYINYEGADSVTYEAGKPATVTVKFRNVGNTPAREVRAYGVLVNAWPIVSVEFGKDTVLSKSGLGPQVPFHFNFNTEWVITEKDISDLMSREDYWYISVKITYTDIFGGKDSTGVGMIWDEGAWTIRQDMDADNNYAE